MTFSDWFGRSQALRRDTAYSRPVYFLSLEVGRFAAVMALVLVVGDATPWAFTQGGPWARLWFVGTWSFLMAGLSLVRLRASRERSPASPPLGGRSQ